MSLTEAEARRRIVPDGGRDVILDDATVERDWGWVFVWNSRAYAESGDQRDMLIGPGPVAVDRESGRTTSYPSSLPALAAAHAHERATEGTVRFALRRLRARWITRPRRDAPGLPRDRDEADAVYEAWERRGRARSSVCDLRLTDGRVLRSVVLDADTRVAVLADDRPLPAQARLWGAAVAEWLVVSDGGEGRATEAEREKFTSAG